MRKKGWSGLINSLGGELGIRWAVLKVGKRMGPRKGLEGG